MRSAQYLLYLQVFLATLGGCEGIDPSGIVPGEQAQDQVHFLRVRDVDGPQMEAQLEGKLVLSEGCLRIQVENEEAYTTIWQNDFSYRKQGDSVAVLNGEGQIVARVGDRILVSGGEGGSPSQEKFAESYVGPYQCVEPYWIVGYEVSILTP